MVWLLGENCEFHAVKGAALRDFRFKDLCKILYE